MIQYISKPFKWFFKLEAASGLVLLFAAIIALIVSNTDLSIYYKDILDSNFRLGIGKFGINLTILHWINDVLMAIFFFLVSLEIKREFIQGELSNPKQAMLPIIGAVGGMLVPALIYIAINYKDPVTLNGWAIPSATDIAFSLGVLSLLGKRVPLSLKVFLTALAIIDDLGAIIIIAFFYSGQVQFVYLLLMLVCMLILLLFNKLNIRNFIPYLIVGVFLWEFTHASGIHATISGVLLAIFIPHKKTEQRSLLTCAEDKLHPWVAYFIMPMFALANAGVYLGDVSLKSLTNPIPLGVMTGLFFGKQIGVFLTTFLLIKLGYARLPSGSNWIQIYGVAALTGIGFTMAMFINFLAFDSDTYISQAKIGILIASFLSAVLGYILLNFKSSRN